MQEVGESGSTAFEAGAATAQKQQIQNQQWRGGSAWPLQQQRQEHVRACIARAYSSCLPGAAKIELMLEKRFSLAFTGGAQQEHIRPCIGRMYFSCEVSRRYAGSTGKQ